MELVVREITMTAVKRSKPEKEWIDHHNDSVRHHYTSIIIITHNNRNTFTGLEFKKLYNI